MDLRRYSEYCGPGAFAAVTGASRNDAAKALLCWCRHAGMVPNLSTAPTVLAAALMMRGFRLERWSTTPGGWRDETAAEFSRRIWATIRNHGRDWSKLFDAVENLAQFDQNAAPEIQREIKRSAERSRRRRPRRMIVREWMARRRSGTWLLHVDGHVMVQRDGRIIAGDDAQASEYGGDALRDVWRVLPRSVFSVRH